MPYNQEVIVGSRSVSQNKTPLNQNSQYINDIANVDHYWDQANNMGNTNFDGHHRVVQMPKFDGGMFNPLLDIAADMDGAYYVEEIMKEDGTEEVNAFYAEKAKDQISYLGIRASVNCNGGEALGNQTINWQHNVASVNRTGDGTYTLTFTKPLPSANYTASILAYRNGTPLFGAIQAQTNYTDAVKVGSFLFRIVDTSGAATNANRIQLSIIGG